MKKSGNILILISCVCRLLSGLLVTEKIISIICSHFNIKLKSFHFSSNFFSTGHRNYVRVLQWMNRCKNKSASKIDVCVKEFSMIMVLRSALLLSHLQSLREYIKCKAWKGWWLIRWRCKLNNEQFSARLSCKSVFFSSNASTYCCHTNTNTNRKTPSNVKGEHTKWISVWVRVRAFALLDSIMQYHALRQLSHVFQTILLYSCCIMLM